MNNCIQTAASADKKKALFNFRYRIYIEEMNKYHLDADHLQKQMTDESDSFAVQFFVENDNGIIGTARLQNGSEGIFASKDIEFFNINSFERYIGHDKLAIVDRLIVKKEYRNSSIAHRIILATYINSLKAGTRVCFICCEDKLLPMYLRYGFREYAEPATLSSGEKRHRLVLFLCDAKHLQKTRSPFLEHLPAEMDDKGYYVVLVKKRLGICFANGGVCQGNCCVEKNQNHHSLIEIADKLS